MEAIGPVSLEDHPVRHNESFIYTNRDFNIQLLHQWTQKPLRKWRVSDIFEQLLTYLGKKQSIRCLLKDGSTKIICFHTLRLQTGPNLTSHLYFGLHLTHLKAIWGTLIIHVYLKTKEFGNFFFKAGRLKMNSSEEVDTFWRTDSALTWNINILCNSVWVWKGQTTHCRRDYLEIPRLLVIATYLLTRVTWWCTFLNHFDFKINICWKQTTRFLLLEDCSQV